MADASAPKDSPGDSDLTLIVGGKEVGGWENIAVTLRAEGFPNSFDIGASSLDPSTGLDLIARPGDACQVKLGKSVVVTGYVDRVSNGGASGSHSLRVIGRGKCQDLVDCSAEWEGGQIKQTNALDLATKLAAPYGITVKLGEGAAKGPDVPQFSLTYGETSAEIIQRVARSASLLAYETADGALVLGAVGAVKAASGATYSENVEQWDVELAMDARFSDIVCTQNSQDIWADLGEAGFFFDRERDPNVPRHRLMYMVLEAVATDPQAFTTLKAKWEMARRAGRSMRVSATVDSWRDSAGKLWAPNTLIPVALPGLPTSASPLCLSEVTFRRGDDGTHADLTLFPKEAFSPEPIVLQPVNTADIMPAPQ